jgi:hypothetical protein
MRGHLNGRIILIFSVNKRCSAGFLVENIEQYRREPLKDELVNGLGKCVANPTLAEYSYAARHTRTDGSHSDITPARVCRQVNEPILDVDADRVPVGR